MCPLAEASFHSASFDLHVLGTPPAFVLSQDQTLNKSYHKPPLLPERDLSSTLTDRDSSLIIRLTLRNFYTCSSSLEPFSLVLKFCLSYLTMFNFQGTFAVFQRVSISCVQVSPFSCSRRFPSLAVSHIIIPLPPLNVKPFFQIFFEIFSRRFLYIFSPKTSILLYIPISFKLNFTFFSLNGAKTFGREGWPLARPAPLKIRTCGFPASASSRG